MKRIIHKKIFKSRIMVINTGKRAAHPQKTNRPTRHDISESNRFKKMMIN